jgi:hypothetical protein
MTSLLELCAETGLRPIPYQEAIGLNWMIEGLKEDMITDARICATVGDILRVAEDRHLRLFFPIDLQTHAEERSEIGAEPWTVHDWLLSMGCRSVGWTTDGVAELIGVDYTPAVDEYASSVEPSWYVRVWRSLRDA